MNIYKYLKIKYFYIILDGIDMELHRNNKHLLEPAMEQGDMYTSIVFI